MARFSLRAALGAVLLSLVSLLTAAPPDEPQNKEKLQTTLAVQAALRQGRDQLQSGNFQAAVFALEREVHRCGGDKDYLAALEDAYRGLIRQLQDGHHDAEVAKYADYLAALDPSSRLVHTPPALAELAMQKTPATPTETVKQPEVRCAVDHKSASVESDPFSDANRAPRDVNSLLTRADQEFKDKHYQTACRLYQEAHTIDPNAMVSCCECWGYCKLYSVVEALNQPNRTAAANADLEREVRQAITMAPKLEKYGEPLLRKLQDRGTPGKNLVGAEGDEEVKFEMRHLGTQGQWSVLETPHFRILHNQSAEVAEKAAKIVEKTRVSMSKKWFGDTGEAWNPRCDVYLHATGQDYSRATGVPAQSPGHSTIRAEGERVLSRRVDLHCDDPNWPIGVLPHETTHVVLAGRYGANAVPRWADEGMAVLAEPRDRIERHLRNLPRHRDDHVLFNVGKLMEMNDYPNPQYIGPFYAESVSLVEYLSSLKGSQEYTAFLRDGLRGGYEPALQKHFGIQGYADLQRRWETAAFNPQSGTAEAMR